MKKLTKLIPFSLMFAVVGMSAASAISSHAQGAMATISAVQDGVNWDYTIVLQNTGGTDLATFWYGWTDNGNNLPSNPFNAANSLGWDSGLDGNSIYYTQNSFSGVLAAGDSATFTFQSTSDPTAMTTGDAGASVVYDDNYGESPQFSPTLVSPVPEPSSTGLLAAGGLGLVLIGWQKSRKPQLQTVEIRK